MARIRRFIALIVALALGVAMCACAPKEEKVVVDTEGLTEVQKAIVLTAESFYLRGSRAQYDMGSLSSGLARRVVQQKAPEDYTSQNRGYTDCSGFAFDVYWQALGIEISSSTAWTKTLADQKLYRVLRERPISQKFDTLSEEELQAKQKEFADTLQPGDLIVQRYAGDESGHVMLYVGNGMFMHSSGNSYNAGEKKERFEENGTFLYDPIEQFYDPSHRRYLFDKATYTILRPLDGFSGEIPQATLTRMSTMRGIMAEKLSSHTKGQTVNPNDEITFTFHLENASNFKKTVTITDTVPANATYVAGAQTVEDDQLSWTVTVPAKGEADVSYTVKVTGAAGETVKGNGAVEGIAVECPAVTIGNTLSKTQQQALIEKAKQGSQLCGIARVNELYIAATGKAAFADDATEETIPGTVFSEWISDRLLDREGNLFPMVAPNLYGGKSVIELFPKGDEGNARTRAVETEYLIVGDIIFTDGEWYVFLGDSLLNTLTAESVSTDVMESFLGNQYFAVLRPSLMQ